MWGRRPDGGPSRACLLQRARPTGRPAGAVWEAGRRQVWSRTGQRPGSLEGQSESVKEFSHVNQRPRAFVKMRTRAATPRLWELCALVPNSSSTSESSRRAPGLCVRADLPLGQPRVAGAVAVASWRMESRAWLGADPQASPRLCSERSDFVEGTCYHPDLCVLCPQPCQKRTY